ncbi:hypothetical protein ACFP65_08255 [Marinilactibacillus sp. GCM10026970]|uniref:hypothetical protein n=1 Tax=Marinilactibacillus sp. GCM10026970 TaxID=3252642 RepID=UPI003613BBBD
MNTIVVFLTNGETLYFEEVKTFNSTEDGIAFNYKGKRTETERGAVFLFSNMAGFALNKDYKEPEVD